MLCKNCRYCVYYPQTTDYICTVKLPPWAWVSGNKRINIATSGCDIGKKVK